MVFEGIRPDSTSVDIESQVGTPGLTYTVEAWNSVTNTYDQIGIAAGQFNSDQTVNFVFDPENIDASGVLRLRVGWRVTGFILNFPWEVRIDHINPD